MLDREKLKQIIDEAAIDAHVHVGDDELRDGPLRRMWTVAELSQLGINSVAKAHFLPFVPETNNTHGSVTLNSSLDPKIIEKVAKEMSKLWVIWAPTLNAATHREVTQNDEFWKKLFEDIELTHALSVLDEQDNITAQFEELLSAIAHFGAIFATGHLSAREVMRVVPTAIERGVKKIILTHVSSRHNKLTLKEQAYLFGYGDALGSKVYSEHCAITWFDGKPGAYGLVRDFVEPIIAIDPARLLITSDTGRYVPTEQYGNRPITPQECLFNFCSILLEAGVPIEILSQSLITNTRQLLHENK